MRKVKRHYFIHQFDGSRKTMFSIATPCCVVIRGKVVPRNSQMVGQELNFENRLQIKNKSVDVCYTLVKVGAVVCCGGLFYFI